MKPNHGTKLLNLAIILLRNSWADCQTKTTFLSITLITVLRVTGATNLTRCGFSARQIMAITGHKSIESLAIYQKVQEDEKLKMGISLMFNLFKPAEAMKI